MPRKLSLLYAVATAAIFLAGPAAAATLTVAAAPGNAFANQACDGPGGPFSGSATQRVTRVCSRADVGESTGSAVASVGHLGATSLSTSHNNDSLGAGIGAQADFSDIVTFTSANPALTEADVSLNLLLDGILDKNGFNAAGLELFVILGGQFTKLAMRADADGFTVGQNGFLTSGTLGPTTNAILTTPTLHVFLNSPMLLRLDLLVSSSASGPGGAAQALFGGSFKFPSSGVFNLADGITANAGDYLVDNRFIDPLAPAGGVPEPEAWALMLSGFGLAGGLLRRRRALAAAA